MASSQSYFLTTFLQISILMAAGGWMDGRMDGRTDEWTDGQMNVVQHNLCPLLHCGEYL